MSLTSTEPLFELASAAPSLFKLRMRHGSLSFAFSNDESAPYFEQTQARTALPDYQAAEHPVGMVIGESALAANLHFVPEPTVLIVDQNKDMVMFMQRYVEALRTAGSIEEWREEMGLTGDPEGRNGPFVQYANRLLDAQIKEWERNGYDHALSSEAAFQEAQAIAREKALIPWWADVSNAKHMRRLGGALTEAEATVTMLNLSNVAVFDDVFEEAAGWAERLRELPMTPDAPILTTSQIHKVYEAGIESFLDLLTGKSGGSITVATGPFFGLDNLAQHGGSTSEENPGPIAMPQLLQQPRTRNAQEQPS